MQSVEDAELEDLDERGRVLRAEGDLRGALKVFQQMVAQCDRELASDGPDETLLFNTATSLRRVVDVLLSMERPRAALPSARRALRIAEADAKRRPTELEALQGLDLSLDQVGDLYRLLDRHAEAVATHERSVRVARGMASLAPAD